MSCAAPLAWGTTPQVTLLSSHFCFLFFSSDPFLRKKRPCTHLRHSPINPMSSVKCVSGMPENMLTARLAIARDAAFSSWRWAQCETGQTFPEWQATVPGNTVGGIGNTAVGSVSRSTVFRLFPSSASQGPHRLRFFLVSLRMKVPCSKSPRQEKGDTQMNCREHRRAQVLEAPAHPSFLASELSLDCLR